MSVWKGFLKSKPNFGDDMVVSLSLGKAPCVLIEFWKISQLQLSAYIVF